MSSSMPAPSSGSSLSGPSPSASAFRGKGGKLGGKGGYGKAVRHNASGRTCHELASNGVLKRLARRGGCKRLAAKTLKDFRELIKMILSQIVLNAHVYCVHGRRKTITPMDIARGARRLGITLYGAAEPGWKK